MCSPLARSPLPRSAQDLGIEVGSKAPAVVVHTLDGKQVDLGQYIGKTPMLIEFWATWCGNCRELMPALLEAEKKYGKRVKFVALAVAINQSPERVRRYIAAHPVPHETFYDTDGKAAGAFDAPATSYVVVLDKTGQGGLHRARWKAGPRSRAQENSVARGSGGGKKKAGYPAFFLFRGIRFGRRSETVDYRRQLGVGGGRENLERPRHVRDRVRRDPRRTATGCPFCSWRRRRRTAGRLSRPGRCAKRIGKSCVPRP